MITDANNHLIIFFMPGLGGHHLANIFNLTKCYKYSVDYDRYRLGQKNAHFFHNTDDRQDFTIHLFHFGNANDEKIFEIQKKHPTQFVLIHLPEKNELAWKRLEILNGQLRLPLMRDVVYDLTKLYKQHFLEKIYPGTWNTIMADDFFSLDYIDQLVFQVEQISGTSVEKTLVNKIHIQWLSNIQTQVNDYQSNLIKRF